MTARADGASGNAAISRSGAFVAYGSVATNLIADGDVHSDTSDVFRRGPINAH